MTRTTTAMTAACLLISLATAGHALAADTPAVTNGVGVQVQGRAPTACSVGVSRPLDTATASSSGRQRISLGRLEERCNSGSGFDTFAATFPAQPGAQFIVDSAGVPTSASGITRIDGSNTAGDLVRTLAYETDEGPPQTMTFTIRAR